MLKNDLVCYSVMSLLALAPSMSVDIERALLPAMLAVIYVPAFNLNSFEEMLSFFFLLQAYPALV